MIPSIQKNVYYPFVTLIFHLKSDLKITILNVFTGEISSGYFSKGMPLFKFVDGQPGIMYTLSL